MSLLGVEMSASALELLTKRFAAETNVDGPPRIAVDNHVAVARALRDELGYKLFEFVVAAHYPAIEGDAASSEKIRVVFGLRSIGKGSNIAAWQVEVEVGQTVPSLVELFAGADWQEREQYDLVGVRFANHPDMRRFMLPEDWKGHPLRKDYAIDTEVPPWR